jgi:class 3 adenylate cyclase
MAAVKSGSERVAKPILETEPHSPNRALVASFLFTDLVGFSKGTAAEQYAAKATLSSILRNNLGALRDADYRLKDTGDGALIAFTANPEHALFMALAIDQDFGRAAADAGFPSNSLRTGVHLGAVKEAIDLEARPNFVGDGINAAKRIMDFAAPGQITASRAFFDAVAGLDAAYASLFTHVGAPDDKHGRAHELYAISPSAAVLERLKVDLGVKPQTIPQRPAAPATTSVSAPAASRNPGDAPASAMSGRWIAVSTAIALGIAAVYVGTRVIDSGPPRGPQPTETVASPPSSARSAPASTVPSESPAPTVSQPTPETAAPAAAPRVVDAEPAPGPPQPASAAPAAPAKTNVKTKPRAEVNATAPVAGNALPDRNSPRCSRIMEKATLGETLTTEEKKELASSCR